jgi:amidophosphoribosyltransferase
MGADFVRDIEPGEIVIIDETGVRSVKPFGAAPRRFCIFEYIYFARPDSVVEGTGVYQSRKRIGAELARESHVDADVVVPVPDSGVPAAMGYASEARIPYELGIIRNHYVGRTFIEPTDQIRHLGVKLKHSANRAMLEGKRVILVDDSIVRGTTSKKIVEMVRQAGAAEVHMRISSPPPPTAASTASTRPTAPTCSRRRTTWRRWRR